MTKEIQTMYLSKYALTNGLEAIAVTVNDGYARRVDGWWSSYKIGRDIHETYAAAIAAAEAARLKKIKSLKAQLKKLEALTFTEAKE